MYFALLGPSTNLNTQPQQWATLFTLLSPQGQDILGH